MSKCPRRACDGTVVLWGVQKWGKEISCLLCGRVCSCEYYSNIPCELHA